MQLLKRWGRSGKSGKPLGGVLGAPGDGAGAPKSVLGAYWGVLMPLGGLLGGLLGHLCVQKAPWRHLESAQNHVFYKGFWHFRVLVLFASKNAALRALGGDLGGLGSLLGAPWGLLGASWGRVLGASWGRLGGVLGGPGGFQRCLMTSAEWLQSTQHRMLKHIQKPIGVPMAFI